MGLLSILVFLFISLVMGAILKFALKKTPLPYTVGLFIFGIIGGILARKGLLSFEPIVENAFLTVGNTSPNSILYIFLPILIFEAAYNLDIHIFRKSLVNTSLLAVPGVIFAMFATGALVMLVTLFVPQYAEWTWISALMFGALISATDPVAVVALLKELNTSKRFSTLVDSESMLNDGTGIVLFMLFFGAYTAKGMSNTPIADFIFVVAGGALVGFVLASLCMLFITRIKSDSVVQNSIIIVCAYLTFYVAEGVMEVSGVISLVVFGLLIAYYGHLKLNKRVTVFIGEFWELASYLANTLIFIVVGVLVATKVHFSWSNILVLAILYIGVNAIRTLMIFVFFPILHKSGYGLSKRESLILSWGGLRGALGLSLALMVLNMPSIPEDLRNQILFQTAGIVTLTLTINATTIGWLLRKLGLTRQASSKVLLEYGIRRNLSDDIQKYYAKLQEQKALEGADWQQVQKSLPVSCEIINVKNVDTNDVIANIRLKILEKEKTLCWQLYGNGVISAKTLRKTVNVIEDELDADGKLPFSHQYDMLIRKLDKPVKVKRFPLFRKWLYKHFHTKIIARYDLCRGFMILQYDALKMAEDINSSQVFSDSDKEKLNTICRVVKGNIETAENYLKRIAEEHPVSYKKAITLKAERMLQSKKTEIVRRYQSEGLLSEQDAQEIIEKI